MKKSWIIYFKAILIIAVIIFSIDPAYSQRWNSRRYEFHVGLGASNFMGDICAPNPQYHTDLVWVKFFNTIGYLGDVQLKYALSPRNSLGAGLYLGTINGEDPIDNQKYWYHEAVIKGQESAGLRFKSMFTEVSGRYEFLFIKEKRKKTVYRRLGQTGLKNLTLPSYVFIGVGAMANRGKFIRNVNNGRARVTYTYFNVAPVVPVGFGTKIRLDYNIYMNIEAGWRFTLSDGIDDASGKDNDAFGEWYDQYQFVTFNLVYKLRAKRNKMPNFRF